MGLFDKLKKKEAETPTNNVETQILPENNNMVQSTSIDANQTVVTPVGIDNNPFTEELAQVSSDNIVSQEIPTVDNIFNVGPNDLINQTIPTQQAVATVENTNINNQGVLNVDYSSILGDKTFEDETTQLVSESVNETSEPVHQTDLQNTNQMASNLVPQSVTEMSNNQMIDQSPNISTQQTVNPVVESSISPTTDVNIVQNEQYNEEYIDNTIINAQEGINPANQAPIEQPIINDITMVSNLNQVETPITTNLESQELITVEEPITQYSKEEQVEIEQPIENQEVVPTEETNEPFILEEPEHTEVEYVTSDSQGINIMSNEVPPVPENIETTLSTEQPIIANQELVEEPNIEQQPMENLQIEEVQPTIENSMIEEPTYIENQGLLEEQVITENQQNIEAQPVIEKTEDVSSSLDEVEETPINNDIQESIVELEQQKNNVEVENPEINLENSQSAEISDNAISTISEENNVINPITEEPNQEIQDIQSVENYIPPEIAESQNMAQISNEEEIETNKDIIELSNPSVTEEVQEEIAPKEEATILEKTNELILQSIAEEQESSEEVEENKPLISEEPAFDLPVILGNTLEDATNKEEEEKKQVDSVPTPLINEKPVELNIDTQTAKESEETVTHEETQTPILPIITEEDIVIPSENEENKKEENKTNSSSNEETTSKEQPTSIENEKVPTSEDIYKEEPTNLDVPNLKNEEQSISNEETIKQPAFDFQPFMKFNAQNMQEQYFDKPTVVESNEQYGTYISESTPTKFCNNCGVMLTDDSSICPSCGEPID